jgi:glycine/D-amino acid oxidase-like deaminating enzyme/nitrite reductase/ring-hydroxylating ferredoxin subunit
MEAAVNVSQERTVSLWMETKVAPHALSLRANEKADVVVIGAGIAGLSTAYELAAKGYDVVVLDRGAIGTGMTARTTAHLASDSDDSFESLIKARGLDAAKLFYQSHAAAIDRIEEIQRGEQIACDFRRVDGCLFPALESDPSILEGELDAARQVGISVSQIRGLPFEGQEDAVYLRYANQATFHPTKYLQGLARYIEGKGGRLYCDTAVVSVEEKSGGIVVSTESGSTVRTKFAVVATNSPINDLAAIHSKQGPYRTYAMAFTIPRGAIPDALYWDTHDPYHYVRLAPGPGSDDYLIVGGEDHKSGVTDDAETRFRALETWSRSLVAQLGRETHRWSGQVLEPVDHAAFIGRNPGNRNVYVATGDSGQGITHGVVASILISCMIAGGESPWASLYDPSRKTASALHSFIEENLTAVKNFAEYLGPGELNSLDELRPGSGAIVRNRLQKIAAYRDEEGVLHLHSAKCTHLGCLVHWNSLEHCWDCPCHGSHFAADGTVLNAPALSPLDPVDATTIAGYAERRTTKAKA